MTKDKTLKAFIHTVQIKSPEGISDEILQKKPKYLGSENKISVKRGFLHKINPNEYIGSLYNYSDFILIMQAIQEELEISEWEYDRIDVAVDSTRTYEELFKLNKYLASLLSLHIKGRSFTDTRGAMDGKKRSLKVWKGNMDIEIYDKNLESKGKHPYTRCEFRFKLLDEEREKAIFNTIYEILDKSKKHIKELNEIKTENLYKKWCTESENGEVSNINEFYRKYSDEIYTVTISKKLFKKITKNESSYKDWIGNFRRKLKIKFVSGRILDQYISEIKDAIERYRTS